MIPYINISRFICRVSATLRSSINLPQRTVPLGISSSKRSEGAFFVSMGVGMFLAPHKGGSFQTHRSGAAATQMAGHIQQAVKKGRFLSSNKRLLKPYTNPQLSISIPFSHFTVLFNQAILQYEKPTTRLVYFPKSEKLSFHRFEGRIRPKQR